MPHFNNPMQQRVYDFWMANPAEPRRRADGSLGGDTSSCSFRAGYQGVKGIHRGVPTSAQRAAWMAGRDTAKAEGR